MPRPPILAADPTAPVETHEIDDRFIPVRAAELLAALNKLGAKHGFPARDLRDFETALRTVIEQEAAAFARDLADEYAPFNPDRETLPQKNEDSVRTPEGYAKLHARLEYLLDKANFERLNDVQIDKALEVASSQGVTVRLNPERIEELSLWVRGYGEIQRTRRTWKRPIRGVQHRLEVYRRLAVVARLKDDPHVLIKLFKDIPEEDVEALLPHAEVRMGWLDRVFMLSGGVGAAGSTAMKFTSALKLLSTGLFAFSRLLWLLIFGFSVMTWRVFHGYRRTRMQRDSQRTRHLYYQNLSNNLGAIYTFVALVSQEELKEAALTYWVCTTAQPAIQSAEDLKARVERLLTDTFGSAIDFDVKDAIQTLDRMKLWNDRASWRVLPLEQAAARLSAHWIERRTEPHHWNRSVAKS